MSGRPPNFGRAVHGERETRRDQHDMASSQSEHNEELFRQDLEQTAELDTQNQQKYDLERIKWLDAMQARRQC